MRSSGLGSVGVSFIDESRQSLFSVDYQISFPSNVFRKLTFKQGWMENARYPRITLETMEGKARIIKNRRILTVSEMEPLATVIWLSRCSFLVSQVYALDHRTELMHLGWRQRASSSSATYKQSAALSRWLQTRRVSCWFNAERLPDTIVKSLSSSVVFGDRTATTADQQKERACCSPRCSDILILRPRGQCVSRAA